jgi:hypothetical protein
MNEQIKLIWDFYGDEAEKIAEHHKIHLIDFDKKENLDAVDFGIEKLSSSHSIAYIVVIKNTVLKVRDALLPHRAEIVEEP